MFSLVCPGEAFFPKASAKLHPYSPTTKFFRCFNRNLTVERRTFERHPIRSCKDSKVLRVFSSGYTFFLSDEKKQRSTNAIWNYAKICLGVLDYHIIQVIFQASGIFPKTKPYLRAQFHTRQRAWKAATEGRNGTIILKRIGQTMTKRQGRTAIPVVTAILPVALLISALIATIIIKGPASVSTTGPYVLFIAAGCALALGIRHGSASRRSLTTGLLRSGGQTLPAIPMLLCIAMISTTWMLLRSSPDSYMLRS